MCNNGFCNYSRCGKKNTCGYLNSQTRKFDYNYDYHYVDNYGGYNELPDFSFDYRAPQEKVNRILDLLSEQETNLFHIITRLGVPRRELDDYFRTVIDYTLDNESNYSGNINVKVNSIYNDFTEQHGSVINALRDAGVGNNIIYNAFRSVIGFTLR
ncbi:MAG: sialidase, partial [Clostridium sp.]